MNIKLIFSVVIIMTFGMFPNPGNSECCLPVAFHNCDDGSKPSPYCAYGPCNPLGCDCEGGCRSAKKREINENNGFGSSESDGKLSLNEVFNLMSDYDQEEINKRDLDGGGLWNYDEDNY